MTNACRNIPTHKGPANINLHTHRFLYMPHFNATKTRGSFKIVCHAGLTDYMLIHDQTCMPVPAKDNQFQAMCSNVL